MVTEVEHKSGFLNETGGDVWKVFLYELEATWFLIVRYDLSGKKQYFRLGSYCSRDEAAQKAETICPWKLGKTQKIGTTDLYRNRTWRVRIKYERENLHIGYYPKPEEAHRIIMKVMNDKTYLTQKLTDLLRKRKANLQRCRKRRQPDTWDDADEPERKRPFVAGKKRWKSQEISLMLQLRQEMHSWQSIAKRFGRTVEACKSRVWRHINYNNVNNPYGDKPFVKTEPDSLYSFNDSGLGGFPFTNRGFRKSPYPTKIEDLKPSYFDYTLRREHLLPIDERYHSSEDLGRMPHSKAKQLDIPSTPLSFPPTVSVQVPEIPSTHFWNHDTDMFIHGSTATETTRPAPFSTSKVEKSTLCTESQDSFDIEPLGIFEKLMRHLQ